MESPTKRSRDDESDEGGYVCMQLDVVTCDKIKGESPLIETVKMRVPQDWLPNPVENSAGRLLVALTIPEWVDHSDKRWLAAVDALPEAPRKLLNKLRRRSCYQTTF
jgi:hypothetical protein